MSRYQKIINASRKRDLCWWLIYLVVFAVASGILFCSRSVEIPQFASDFRWAIHFMMLASVGYFGFLFISRLFYRHYSGNAVEFPGCTVIVPAYNEGSHVASTLFSLLKAGYPEDKLQIIAVNDGSQDDTLSWMQFVRERAGKRIEIIDLPRNCGKKHALYCGIKAAVFDYIVTCDSDSLVAPGALQKLLLPFADRRVGAVAGNIRGKWSERNFFALMMDVALVFGCEFLRMAQSVSGTVFCTPGAFSAYRKEALLPVIDEWLAQKFLGSPAKIGEDRAIATLLLRGKWHIVHQQDAVAETCLPHNYTKLCRMLLRWNRSDYRENINMIPMLCRNTLQFSGRNVILFIHWLLLGTNMILPFVFLPLSVMMLCRSCSWYAVPALWFVTISLGGVIPAWIYGKSRSVKSMIRAFVFAIFSIPALSWLGIYALFTVGDSRWLTREKRVVNS